MLYILAVFLVFLVFSIGSLALKKHNSRLGGGIGTINRRKWGMEDVPQEFHE